MEKYNIVCLSNQFFDQELKTNKWHMMTRLSRLGHNVVFVDPPTRFARVKRLLKRELSLFHFLIGLKRHNGGNLLVYTPINLFNFSPFSIFNILVQTLRINTFLRSFEKRRTILWVYHFDYPGLEKLLKRINYDLLVYDVVDEYSSFPEYLEKSSLNKGLVRVIESFDNALKIKLNQGGLSGKAWVNYRETLLSKCSDIIFATTPALVEKFKKLCMKLGKNENLVFYTPNCGDYERFKNSKSYKNDLPNDLGTIPSPVIATAGAIDSYKIDVKLIEKCARKYPQFSFVLIGPKKVSDPNLDLTQLLASPNVYFLGEKKFQDLPKYYAGIDCYFIPYKLNDYTLGGCYPVKFHEALSVGLPVVVTNMPVYKDFEDICYIAKSDEDFVSLIDVALREDSDERATRRKIVASKNSWEVKVEKVLKILEDYESTVSR
ncbi:MAG: glycosyltransferase [Patescibacteria group bacterium]